MSFPNESASTDMPLTGSSLTLPLQELATLFSRPLASIKPEPMDQIVHPHTAFTELSMAPRSMTSDNTVVPAPQHTSLHIEVCQAPCSTLRMSQIRDIVRDYLKELGSVIGELEETEFDDPVLKEHVLSILMTDVPNDQVKLIAGNCDLWQEASMYLLLTEYMLLLLVLCVIV